MGINARAAIRWPPITHSPRSRKGGPGARRRGNGQAPHAGVPDRTRRRGKTPRQLPGRPARPPRGNETRGGRTHAPPDSEEDEPMRQAPSATRHAGGRSFGAHAGGRAGERVGQRPGHQRKRRAGERRAGPDREPQRGRLDFGGRHLPAGDPREPPDRRAPLHHHRVAAGHRHGQPQRFARRRRRRSRRTSPSPARPSPAGRGRHRARPRAREAVARLPRPRAVDGTDAEPDPDAEHRQRALGQGRRRQGDHSGHELRRLGAHRHPRRDLHQRQQPAALRGRRRADRQLDFTKHAGARLRRHRLRQRRPGSNTAGHRERHGAQGAQRRGAVRLARGQRRHHHHHQVRPPQHAAWA